MTDLEDSSIVELYLSRDEDAIFQTSKKYGSRLRALSLGIVADHFTAEECETTPTWKRGAPSRPMSQKATFTNSWPGSHGTGP